eukprot:10053181-Ditylum_brightwellii.AAC.1
MTGDCDEEGGNNGTRSTNALSPLELDGTFFLENEQQADCTSLNISGKEIQQKQQSDQTKAGVVTPFTMPYTQPDMNQGHTRSNTNEGGNDADMSMDEKHTVIGELAGCSNSGAQNHSEESKFASFNCQSSSESVISNPLTSVLLKDKIRNDSEFPAKKRCIGSDVQDVVMEDVDEDKRQASL